MVKKKLPVRWSPQASQRLNAIYDYIGRDSVSAARYVKKSLIQLGATLGHFPEKYAKEEYLAEVPGNFRSVSKWRYKLIYEVTEEYVIIINVFITDRHPSRIQDEN